MCLAASVYPGAGWASEQCFQKQVCKSNQRILEHPHILCEVVSCLAFSSEYSLAKENFFGPSHCGRLIFCIASSKLPLQLDDEASLPLMSVHFLGEPIPAVVYVESSCGVHQANTTCFHYDFQPGDTTACISWQTFWQIELWEGIFCFARKAWPWLRNHLPGWTDLCSMSTMAMTLHRILLLNDPVPASWSRKTLCKLTTTRSQSQATSHVCGLRKEECYCMSMRRALGWGKASIVCHYDRNCVVLINSQVWPSRCSYDIDFDKGAGWGYPKHPQFFLSQKSLSRLDWCISMHKLCLPSFGPSKPSHDTFLKSQGLEPPSLTSSLPCTKIPCCCTTVFFSYVFLHMLFHSFTPR